MAIRGTSPQVAITALFPTSNGVPEGNSTYTRERAPSDVKFAVGYGCTQDDAVQGFVDPGINLPASADLENYKDRWNYTGLTDEQIEDRHNFRYGDMESKGFLNRNATDRNR